ncbi:MAG: hypothetical protein AAGF48_15750 [Pseudomonadota bacterium]
MSADFAVFDPASAPKDGLAFRKWYEDRMEWDESENVDDPALLSSSLRSWYTEMTSQFPDFVLTDTDDRNGMDYSFTNGFIYCSMPSGPGDANSAWSLAKRKAKQFGVGTYDCMSDDGRDNSCIVFPDGPLPNPPSFFSRLFGKAKD